MKYSGGAWRVVGSAGISVGRADYTSLAFAPNGTPYVAYTDNGNSGTATVMKYSGGAWSAVGGAVSTGLASFTSLAFAPNGTPYLAYQDGNGFDYGKSSVKYYNDTSWVGVGSAVSAAASFTVLAFAPDGTPFVAYSDGLNSGKSTVMRYNGTSWGPAGLPGFSYWSVYFTSLAVSPDGAPYVAYQDSTKSGKATVMKYIGTSWGPEGSPGFSAGTAMYTSLAFAPDGTPYIAFSDGLSGKATVMKLSAVAVTLTPPATSNLGANQVTLALQSSATGTGYFTLLAGSGATCGTGAQVKAGQTGTGAGAPYHGSLPLVAGTPGSYTVRNLAAATSYTVCFTADNGSTVLAPPATVTVTTKAAASGTTWSAVGGGRFLRWRGYLQLAGLCP